MITSEQDRLASLFGALASTADLAGGFHSEKAIRTAVLATRMAAAHGLHDHQQSDVFYLALVRFIGCTAFSPEAARFGGGDDLSLGAVMSYLDPDEPLQALGRILKGVGRGAPTTNRVKGIVGLLSDTSAPQRHAQTERDVGSVLARRIGMPEPILEALVDMFERWDGKGHPNAKQGDQIALLARVVSLAEVLEIGFSRYGWTRSSRPRVGGQAVASTRDSSRRSARTRPLCWPALAPPRCGTRSWRQNQHRTAP